MKKSDVAWIAGFIDGEGCITINENKRSFRPVLTVSNTKRAPLDFIAKSFGGNVLAEPSRGGNRKPQFRLTYSALKAKQIIKTILPHLKVKKEVAQCVLDFPRRHARSLGKGQGTEVNVAAYTLQKKLLSKVRILNKRGLI